MSETHGSFTESLTLIQRHRGSLPLAADAETYSPLTPLHRRRPPCSCNSEGGPLSKVVCCLHLKLVLHSSQPIRVMNNDLHEFKGLVSGKDEHESLEEVSLRATTRVFMLMRLCSYLLLSPS